MHVGLYETLLTLALQHEVNNLADPRLAAMNGMPLVEEGVEGSAQTVVVELVGRDVPQQFRPGFLGPLGDVDQGGGLGEPGRHQQAENIAVRKFELGVGRQMTIDDGITSSRSSSGASTARGPMLRMVGATAGPTQVKAAINPL